MLSELASSRKRPFRNHARRGRDFRGRPSLAVAMASHFSGEEELPLRQDVKRNPRNLTCRAGLWRPPRPSPGEDGCAPARLFYSGSTPPTHRMGAHLDVAQAQARSSSLTDGRSQDRPQPGGRSHPGQPSPFGLTAGEPSDVRWGDAGCWPPVEPIGRSVEVFGARCGRSSGVPRPE